MKRTKGITGKEILVSDLKRESAAIKRASLAAIQRVLNSGWYILGRELEMFEKEFARYLGAPYACGVASGTEAIQLALKAMHIKPGDEVITAVNTAIPTAMAIVASGASVKFVDVEENTFNMDPSKIEAAITAKTRAIVPVHLYGSPCAIDTVLKIARKHGLYVVEDACQAHGASYKGRMAGTFGDAGAFSFYPTKNLACYGDGGMVVTGNTGIAKKVKLLRNYGQPARYSCEIIGINSRLDELQASVLRTKLRCLDKTNSKRKYLAALYDKYLKNIPEVMTPQAGNDAWHVYHLYVIKCEDRDGLKEYLRKKGVETQIHYPIPLHLQKPFRHLGYTSASFPAAMWLSHKILTLPMFPELMTEEVRKICDYIKNFYDM